MVRAPLLPVESYFALSNENSGPSPFTKPDVRRAVAVASGSLLEAMDRFGARNSARASVAHARETLALPDPNVDAADTVRSLCRSSCCWIRSGNHDSNPVDACFHENPARYGMAHESRRFFRGQPSDPKAPVLLREPIGSCCRRPRHIIRARRFIRRFSDRWGLDPRDRRGEAALSLARAPISYDELLSQLCSTTPSATPERVDKLLSELWEQTFLLTDLRPPLTTSSPAQYVAERLADSGGHRNRDPPQ